MTSKLIFISFLLLRPLFAVTPKDCKRALEEGIDREAARVSYWEDDWLPERPVSDGIQHPGIEYLNSPDERVQALSESQLAELTGIIHDVDGLIYGILEIPDYLILDTKKDGVNGAYQIDSNSLNVPFNLTANSDLSPKLAKKYRTAFLAHEYAHALLKNTIGKEFQREIQKIREKQRQIARQEESATDPSEQRRLSRQYAELTERRIEAKSQYFNLHELFADTVAVLMTEDLSSMRRTLEGTTAKLNRHEWAIVRDFAVQHDLEPWMAEDSHFYFASVRSFLGQKKIHELDKEGKRKLISALVEAAKQYNRAVLSDGANNFIEANTRLIHLIREKWEMARGFRASHK
jgi:hypothetical protein